MESKVVILSEPIEVMGEMVSEIKIPEPRAKDLRDLPLGNLKLGHLLDIASASSGIPKSSFDKLNGADAMAIGDAVGDFLDGGRGAKAPA